MEGWSKSLRVEHGLGALLTFLPQSPLPFVGTFRGSFLATVNLAYLRTPSALQPQSAVAHTPLSPLNLYTPIINTDHIFQGKNSRNCRTKALWATSGCWRQLGKCSLDTEVFKSLQHASTSRERLGHLVCSINTSEAILGSV